MEDLIGGGGITPASSSPSRLRRVPRGEGPSSSSLNATLFRVPDLVSMLGNFFSVADDEAK